MQFDVLASEDVVEKTKTALEGKGYTVTVVENGSEALEKIKTLIPKGSSVMNGNSKTLEAVGYIDYLKSGSTGWNNLHEKVLSEKDPEKQKIIRREVTVSDYYLGSVHALTEDGQMIIASNTGSQIPSIVFNSANLIFVIGTQKIVPDLEEGMKRLENYVVSLEDKHMQDLYHIGTKLNKILIFKGESKFTGRKINIILVKEALGF